MSNSQDQEETDGKVLRTGKGRPIVLPKIIAKGFYWNLFTNTEQRILVLLSDGKDHVRQSLVDCLLDSKFANPTMLNHHTANLRAKLRMINHDIVCTVKNRRYNYRWVRKLLVGKSD